MTRCHIAKRAIKYQTPTAVIRRWPARFQDAQDAIYSILEVKSLYGLPKRFLVVQKLREGGEVVVSRHRKRNSAVEVIERVARSSQGLYQKGLKYGS